MADAVDHVPATAEALKHERYVYLACAGPYTGDDRHTVLAERLEGTISQEHAKWNELSRRTEGADQKKAEPS